MPHALKNNLGREAVEYLGYHLNKANPGFPADSFVRHCTEGLDELELMARSKHIAGALAEVLPTDFISSATMIMNSLHPTEDAELKELTPDPAGIRGWAILPLGEYVAAHGVESFDEGMSLLAELTKRFTSEYAIRPFLVADQQRALEIMYSWRLSSNAHVRRLASEGSRPRLPWGRQLSKLIEDPSPLLPLLRHLRDDDSPYVRKSVANCLNDISKDHPALVINHLQDWGGSLRVEGQRLTRHACRTMIKSCYEPALALVGCSTKDIGFSRLEIGSSSVELGQEIPLTITLTSYHGTEQLVTVDYVIHFRKKNGRLAPKVFRWKVLSIQPGESVVLRKKHPLATISSRTYYPGTHAVSAQVNGLPSELTYFEVTEATGDEVS